MKRKRLVVTCLAFPTFLIVLTTGLVALPASAERPVRPINPAIVAVAQHWLELIDGEEYGQAWQESSAWYRTATVREDFEARTAALRKPLGRQVSRSLWQEWFRNRVNGRPDGKYYWVAFSTTFEHRSTGAFEHVLLEPEDGQWRVTGYVLR